ncbi:hypothetical protein PbB2_00036 [Candidatus Phycosocius bacilliformis]|uniref:Tail specific protease domain-containing protein n=1 Tax=Candidatus Phycosocius bacilliformis TaxID=1445552 RepID=A0A2P2E5P6_9PROT|nr:S41 family peptidase [Candidatus Phycosocius bacilliformis]GBF56381.1 hypothetical protein PbB2_00036 [Candidatus Phycosocius bacilliformis]
MDYGFKPVALGLFVLALAGSAGAQTPRGPILLDAPARIVEGQIDRRSAIDDLRALDQTIRATIPDGAPIPEISQTNAFIANIEAALPATISRREVAAAAMGLAGTYRSSHIYVMFPYENWNLDAARGGKRLDRPIALGSDGSLLIDNRPVERINGRPAADFVAWAKQSYSSYNPLDLPQRIRSRGPDMLWLWGIDGPFRLTFQDGAQMVIDGVTMSKRTHPLLSKSGGGKQDKRGNVPFSLVVDMNVARLTVGAFDQRYENEWGALLTQLRAALSQGKVTDIILDLRGNRGGAGRMTSQLLAVLTNKDVPLSGGKRWKRSKAYEDALAEFVPPLLRFTPWRRAILGADGVAALDSIPMEATRHFEGQGVSQFASILAPARVRVLMDQDTGSSATQLARAIQFFNLGILIGAPSSNPTTELGEIAFFRLKHSQLVFASPSAEFLDVSGKSTVGPVMPDIVLCGDTGLFAPQYALDVALNRNVPQVRQILNLSFRPDAGETDYCRT